MEFCKEYPIKCSQATFEVEKPYYVKTATKSDRNSCLCRKHAEIHKVFEDFTNLRKKSRTDNSPEPQQLRHYSRLTEVVEDTLCPIKEGEKYHQPECLERNYTDCGTDKLKFSASELSMDGEPFTWSRYKYVELKGFENADGTPKKRLSIVSECTAPGKLIEYFLELLATYPFQQFMANWQREQFDSIKEFLPNDHVLRITNAPFKMRFNRNILAEVKFLFM